MSRSCKEEWLAHMPSPSLVSPCFRLHSNFIFHMNIVSHISSLSPLLWGS